MIQGKGLADVFVRLPLAIGPMSGPDGSIYLRYADL